MFEWKKSAGKIYTLPVESIRPSPFQARTVFDEKELAGLAQSIRENGLLQPISVRKVEGGYELVAGERRLRACKLARMETITAILCDCGANADCTPEYLLQFAYLGSFYAQRLMGVEKPRVGLLNIGTEDSKGTDLQKAALALLRQAGADGHLNFIGNIEAKEPIKGGCDVIVTDGFSGNILLKTMEGVGSFAGHALGDIFKKNLLTKLAAAMVMPGLRAFKAQLDPNKVGGTAFIGISKPVIKAHGASNAEAIDNAIGQARQVAESGIIGQIQENVHLMQLQAE